tara:strand:- start:2299 stop:3093 length:795 start_codon:yes stop_codon:yes gene_type:complete
MANTNMHINNILKNGFTLIKGVINRDECDNIKKISQDLYKKYKKKIKIKNPLEEAIYNLHNKDKIFLKYIDYDKTYKVVKKLLSTGAYANNSDPIIRQTAIRNPIIGHAQQLHNDTRIIGCKFPLIIQVIYMLDDFTKLNGATRIVPKSHLKDEYAKSNKKYNNEKIITGQKGDAIILDASIWHGSAKKTIKNDRWGMIYSYCRWFLKASFDHNKNTPIKFYKKLSLEQRKILGFNFNPPKDEFCRSSGRSKKPETPEKYNLPN